MIDLDGIEAAKEVRKMGYKIPIIAMTANASDKDIEDYLEQYIIT